MTNTVGSSIAAGNERSKSMMMQALMAYLGSPGGDASGGLTADQSAAFGAGQGPVSASAATDWMNSFSNDPLFGSNAAIGGTTNTQLIQPGGAKLAQDLSQAPAAAKSGGSY